MVSHDLMNGAQQAANMADVSAVEFLGPVLAFLIVAVILTALLKKIKVLGENMWVNVFLSLFISAVFVSAAGVTQVVLGIVPWLAVLLITLFFILLIAGFVANLDGVKWVGTFFIIVVFIIVLIVATKVFFGSISSYLPGYTFGADPDANAGLLYFFSWLYSPQISGAFWLLLTGVLVAWFLIKKG